MDGLLRSVGDSLTGLVGGALAAVQAALVGIGAALANAIPGGIAGVAVGLVAVVAIEWLLRR